MQLRRIIALAAALTACAVAALAAPATTTISAFLPNRIFGLGEQQVYVIQRDQTLIVRYRNDEGDVVSKTLTRRDSHSVGLTVEGFSANGAAVLGVAVEASQAPASGQQAMSSPTVSHDGSISASGPLAQLGVATMILGNLPNTPLADGMKWDGGGALRMPFGTVNLHVANSAASWTDPTVLQVTSAGTLEANGNLSIAGLGKVGLHGGGTCNGTSFVDMTDALLVGSTFTVASRGNLSQAGANVGDYTMNAAYTLKLARYIPGQTPAPGGDPSSAPGLINGAPLSNDVIRPGGESPVASPAPTDNLFSGASPFATPTPPPEQSLAPIPVIVSSGAPLASPPAPPPTPFPTPSPH